MSEYNTAPSSQLLDEIRLVSKATALAFPGLYINAGAAEISSSRSKTFT
jgi:hypothetical protein